MFAAMQRREVAAAKPSAEEVAAMEAAAAAAAGHGQALTEEEAEVERLRQKELDGTPVTPESFAEWRAKFEAETAPVKEAKVRAHRRERSRGIQEARLHLWIELGLLAVSYLNEGRLLLCGVCMCMQIGGHEEVRP
jgi:hypothetical protein